MPKAIPYLPFLASACGILLITFAVHTGAAETDAAETGAAEPLSAADIAWIDKCIADRAIEKHDPVKAWNYCACMQGIVEDNEPFTPTELEHSYPPAHVMCMEEAGLLR